MFRKTTFNKIQKDLIYQAKNLVYKNRQLSIVQKCKLKNSPLSGDGRCDLPGFNAKYCTYSMMDTDTNKIIDFKAIKELCH